MQESVQYAQKLPKQNALDASRYSIVQENAKRSTGKAINLIAKVYLIR